jgi:hypothetical protein
MVRNDTAVTSKQANRRSWDAPMTDDVGLCRMASTEGSSLPEVAA